MQMFRILSLVPLQACHTCYLRHCDLQCSSALKTPVREEGLKVGLNGLEAKHGLLSSPRTRASYCLSITGGGLFDFELGTGTQRLATYLFNSGTGDSKLDCIWKWYSGRFFSFSFLAGQCDQWSISSLCVMPLVG